MIAANRPGYDGRLPAGGIAYNAAAGLARLNRTGAERATVVGHSFGGAVAAWLAATHPERVSGLVLVAAGLALMSGLSAGSSWTHLLPGFIVADKGGVVRLAELQSQGYVYLRP